jgi:hypothetical protein
MYLMCLRKPITNRYKPIKKSTIRTPPMLMILFPEINSQNNLTIPNGNAQKGRINIITAK